MTSQGQTILVFLGVTTLALPILVLVIAPVAVVVAVAHSLNKLTTDSEIIVMNAAGVRPWQLFRPFLYVTLVVSLMVAFIAAYLAPAGQRRLGNLQTEITADVLAHILQPGRFTQLDTNLTIRVRERQPGGQLVGIFIDDRRDVKERVSIIAERGTVLKNDQGSFLVLEDGTLQRFETGKRDPAIVAFGRYAFDMSKFANTSRNVTFKTTERYLWELWSPSPDDPLYKQLPGQFRAELHNRILAPFYPIAFMLLTFAVLGAPRTTRQSRTFSMATAMLAVTLIRIAGFACAVLTATSAPATVLQYLLLGATSAISIWIISRSIVVDAPPRLMEFMNSLTARMTRRVATP